MRISSHGHHAVIKHGICPRKHGMPLQYSQFYAHHWVRAPPCCHVAIMSRMSQVGSICCLSILQSVWCTA